MRLLTFFSTIFFLFILLFLFFYLGFKLAPRVAAQGPCAVSPLQSGQCSDEAAQITCADFQSRCDSGSLACPGSVSVCTNSNPSSFVCYCEYLPPDPFPTPTPSPTPNPSPTPTPTPSPPSGCTSNADCGVCKQCCAGTPNYCTVYGYFCSGTRIPGCWATPPPSSAPPPPGCPSMTCRYSEAVGTDICSSGQRWVTGTGCNGDNCAGCTYVGGCSGTECISSGATPPPGGGGCYRVKCHNSSSSVPSADTDCYSGSINLSSASCSWSQCQAWNPSEYPQCGSGGTCSIEGAGDCGGGGGSAPACNPSLVNMSASPNPVNSGSNVTFTVSGSQGSTYIEDSWSGGVSCPDETLWGSEICSTNASGTFSWTHLWKNCGPPGDCGSTSSQCSKSISYTITNPAPVVTLNNSCTGSPNTDDEVTISWSDGSPAVTWVNISMAENFSGYWNKAVPSPAPGVTSMIAPLGFDWFNYKEGSEDRVTWYPLNLSHSRTYYARTLKEDRTNSDTASFIMPLACFLPWIQVVGDVHTNSRIRAPGGP